MKIPYEEMSTGVAAFIQDQLAKAAMHGLILHPEAWVQPRAQSWHHDRIQQVSVNGAPVEAQVSWSGEHAMFFVRELHHTQVVLRVDRHSDGSIRDEFEYRLADLAMFGQLLDRSKGRKP